MSKDETKTKVEARTPRGLADREAGELAATGRMLDVIREVYELYGFEALETPAIEYTDALGKFLPDQDRPNEGVFSFQDDDEQWLSLRYDLTAPLARFVAQNFDRLPKPYRSYRVGPVYRNEKPGPGRFRQFMQFDADTVGSASPAADAEICMMAADAMERLGIARGDYVIKINSRKVLDGVMETIGLGSEDHAGRRLTVLRAIDKLDRLGWGGVTQLLREGRRDESGDFTKGANLSDNQVLQFNKSFEANNAIKVLEALGFDQLTPSGDGLTVTIKISDIRNRFDKMKNEEIINIVADGFALDNIQIGVIRNFVQTSINVASVKDNGFVDYDYRNRGLITQLPLIDWAFFNYYEEALSSEQSKLWEGLDELFEICRIVRSAGFGPDRIRIDPSVVRGLEYYTGPVFEADLTFETKDEKGNPVRFGSVGGGGRYDGLVGRFRSENTPATGFSIGVSRLFAALKLIGSPIVSARPHVGPVVVLVLDRDRLADYQRMAAQLRGAGIAAEIYLGAAGMKAQMKYADRRNSPLAIIQGSDEKARGEVTIKDLVAGAKAAANIATNEQWKALRPAQYAVSEAELVEEVQKALKEQI